jgi:hypothetical protein
MDTYWKVFQASHTARYDRQPLTNTPLFAEEDFTGCLLGLLPGQALPAHIHDHSTSLKAAGRCIWMDRPSS